MSNTASHRRLLRWTVIGLVGLAGCLLLIEELLPGLIWDGGAALRLTLHVVDADTRQPVADATVEWGRFSPTESGGAISEAEIIKPNSILPTDRSGEVDVVISLPAGGRRTLLRRTGSMSTRREYLRVNAPGRLESLTPLSDHVDESMSIHVRQPIHVTIALSRNLPGL